MSTLAFTPDLLDTLRQRRAAGASVKALALEIGTSWQKLDKAIRNGFPKRQPVISIEHSTLPARSGSGMLTEKYRPRSLSEIFGQPKAVKFLSRYASSPYPAAMIFSGATGTGKTSAAVALAADLGCDIEESEFGGVHSIASGEQSADAVRECCERMWLKPMLGSGWKVFIINECDRMHSQAETIWLDRLENLPPHTAVIFTTNHPEKLSARFKDRCVHLKFEAEHTQIQGAVRGLIFEMYRCETGRNPDPGTLESIVRDACDKQTHQLSFRRAVMTLQAILANEPISERSSA